MFAKFKFKNNVLSEQNYKLLYKIAYIILFQILVFIIMLIVFGFSDILSSLDTDSVVLEHPEGYASFWEGESHSSGSIFTSIWFYLLLISAPYSFSVILRKSLVPKLQKDEYFIASKLSFKLYKFLIFFWPSIAVAKLLIKSYFPPKTLTTKQLIKKWKIINGIRDVVLILNLIILITLIIHSFSSVWGTFLEFSSDWKSFLLSIRNHNLFISLCIFASIHLPFIFISSYSADLYNEILHKENKQWTQVAGVFFTFFIYIKGWKNIFQLSKELKKIEDELINKEITFKAFYIETIYKLIWQVIGILLIALAFIFYKDSAWIFANFSMKSVMFYILFCLFLTYLVYFSARYISNFIVSTSEDLKPIYKLLYFIDLLIPIMSVYNILKYRKAKQLFLG